MDGSLRVVSFLFLGFLIIASIHPNFFSSGESKVRCIESQRQTILMFKQHIRDPLNRLASWVGDENCCEWVGVVCHNVTSHVHQLHLRSFPAPSYDYSTDVDTYDAKIEAYERSKFGVIPYHLGNLSNLHYLNLEGDKQTLFLVRVAVVKLHTSLHSIDIQCQLFISCHP
uniref:Leucine-rich repeat-containing N-terminal plant-type domain-containing protein n=1 Tax=Fagus sylvatica TaxID=28930 RepID=A0A2N9GEL7_FAGSY